MARRQDCSWHPPPPGTFVTHAYVGGSGFNSDTSNSIYKEIAGYTVVNASVGYRLNEHWEVEVFARNLFDRNYVTALTIQAGNSG